MQILLIKQNRIKLGNDLAFQITHMLPNENQSHSEGFQQME